MTKQSQSIHYTTTCDGIRLAWANSGEGPSLVKTANWITHLEYDWNNAAWGHWVDFFSQHFSMLRYDERGNGLSQHEVDDVSQKYWLSDLETVVDAARPQEPFVLLGISQGSVAAIEFAARYPERVSHLILYGGYGLGWRKRGRPEHEREYEALIAYTELGWGRSEPIYRRLFTKRFLPEGTEEQLGWFDELCATTTSPKMAAKLLDSRGDVDVIGLLNKIKVPTLVLHGNKDRVIPFQSGQELAAGIPGSEFVQLESCNHILLESEPAWDQFKESVLEFTQVESRQVLPLFEQLSAREREILSGIVAGKTNQEIGATLFISEKTVRNHITHIFEKLNVKTRAQAMVLALENGFVG